MIKIFIIILLNTSLSWASKYSFICKKEDDLKTRIFYLNGINKDFNNNDVLNEINQIINRIIMNTNIKNRTVSSIPNQSKNIIQDLLESYRQKINENNRNDWSIKYSIHQKLRNMFFNVLGNNNFDKIYKKLKQEVITGNKIIVLSHSQGNLYANETCKKLKSDSEIPEYIRKIENPFHNIQVATPASYIECGKTYFSLPHDKVVLLTKAGGILPEIEKSLPANIQHSPDFKNRDTLNSFLDHGMIDSYLDDPKISSKIFKSLNYEVNHEYPFHGHNLPIANYMVGDNCYLNDHDRNESNTKKILCKEAIEGIKTIQISSCQKYYLWGYFNQNNFKEQLRIENTQTIFLPKIKQTYNKELGFQAQLIIPKEAGEPESSWTVIKSLAGLAVSFFIIGGLGGVIPRKKREEENQ